MTDDYADGLAVLRARAATEAPATPLLGSSKVGFLATVAGAGLATMLGWAVVESHVKRRIERRRRGSGLVDQFGRPIGKGRS